MFYSINDENDYFSTSKPKTLGEWVKDFRIKKLQMKRRLRTSGGNLRACAIMSTALLSAENQLRLKQQERLNRCLQLQSKFQEKLNRSNFNVKNNDLNNSTADKEEELKRRIEISNLWREELNGLDHFLRKTSTSSGIGSSCVSLTNNGSCAEAANQIGESVETSSALKSIAVLS